jgi:predicted transcriptional regulator
LKEADMSTTTIGQVMTASVVAGQPDTGFKRIVDVLAEYGVSAVPVVDADLSVLGVVSEADLLRPYLRLDDDIRGEVTAEVLQRTLWAEPDTIRVDELTWAFDDTAELRRRFVFVPE